MQDDPIQPNINSWLEDELFQQYKHDRKTVDATWTSVLEGNGHTAQPAAKTALAEPPSRAIAVRATETPAVAVSEDDQLIPLRGPALRIAENMAASLTMPVATSQRSMPVKVIDENRRLINQHRAAAGRSKLSYTHLVAWSIVRAIEAVPAMNQAYSGRGDESFRVARGHVNLGIAVDVAGKDGSRSLKVPGIKHAEAMNFTQFIAYYDDLVARARGNKLAVADFEGVTISLTNPGTVGTVGSIPRLMPGQGAIIATGAIDYPPEYRGVSEDVRSSLGLSKVMTVTCTYDHRVIQG
ncbi:MAG TPA: 2-oxo acid dehydrogenase subunit E2, partial [Bryobacteraceae bacterium]